MSSSSEAKSALAKGRQASPGLVRRLLVNQDLEFWVRHINPLWSLWEPRARIREIAQETPMTKTLVLEPNWHWRGFVAGQFVPVFVEIDGVRERRCYSITSVPGAGRWFSITVGLRAGGRVSTWLHEHACVGEVLPIEAAAGEFVLTRETSGKEKRMFVSGGTGITPIFALLQALAERRQLDGVAVLHFAKTEAEVIFGARLRALAREFPGMSLMIRTTREGVVAREAGPDGGRERLSAELLGELVPDWEERLTYVCGPMAMMDAARAIWTTRGVAARLRTESFGSPRGLEKNLHAGVSGARIVAMASGVEFCSTGRGTLLEQAEQAGLRPDFGCRIGICHTCKCRKRSGTVVNIRTGEISVAEEEDIQLCISVPCSDVELHL